MSGGDKHLPGLYTVFCTLNDYHNNNQDNNNINNKNTKRCSRRVVLLNLSRIFSDSEGCTKLVEG